MRKCVEPRTEHHILCDSRRKNFVKKILGDPGAQRKVYTKYSHGRSVELIRSRQDFLATRSGDKADRQRIVEDLRLAVENLMRRAIDC